MTDYGINLPDTNPCAPLFPIRSKYIVLPNLTPAVQLIPTVTHPVEPEDTSFNDPVMYVGLLKPVIIPDRTPSSVLVVPVRTYTVTLDDTSFVEATLFMVSSQPIALPQDGLIPTVSTFLMTAIRDSDSKPVDWSANDAPDPTGLQWHGGALRAGSIVYVRQLT